MTLDDLVQKLIHYNPEANLPLLRRAYDYAAEAHKGQKRISGDEYITHPLSVAMILADLEMDLATLLAGLLHDVVEDTAVTLDQVRKEFGDEVALLVDGVTKLGRLEFKTKEEQQAENLRKMFLAMARDIRVILIKLADRLHNLRTLKYHPAEKQREISQETLEIYAPLAHRLGIYHLKWELEDLSFRFLNPGSYFDLADRIARSRLKREEYIKNVIQILRQKLSSVGIGADIQGRPKHLYSIYEKMKEQQKDLSEIYDVMALRIIVNSVKDCYAALGTVHTLWKPIPGRFKDYIAMPKTNMYQSLHTSVVGPQGEPLEIQIRTREMHRTAEYGIAAHWRYKEGGRGDRDFDKKLAWLRQLLEWQHDLRDAREFMETLKVDLFADAVFVFTPKGDVFELPAGSVPIDFAYRVHTQVGHSCVGAKVNGRIVPLDYKLKNGDIVEIITSKHPAGPSRDWLNLVKTSQAKNRIRQWFKKEKREENIAKGRDLLERESKKIGLDPDALKGDRLLDAGRRYTLLTVEDIYAAIGEGAVSATLILNRIRESMPEKKPALPEKYQAVVGEPRAKPDWGKPTQGIRVRGVDNLLIRLSHCCNPIPGDPIVGYITRGRGVSIHRADCRNLNFFKRGEDHRLVEVAWDGEFQAPFQVKLEISAVDRAGLLSDVLAVLVEMKINANWVNARGRKDAAMIEMVLEMKSKEQLEYIMARINRVKDVYEVKRTS
ncbi:MAG: bifunctional (p)ppGpp synthetase/guanosine-3',5'-bis(diphosphate) 3'-pyrophosphohydrolase [Peptococcaceae bacterium]|nr:bifunctional (p)ppGpp synthetase/guanosine-3',5'-bis(diphosphate) 3'-pyrophosphohydrolase [Peptococcaceae bacterium]